MNDGILFLLTYDQAIENSPFPPNAEEMVNEMRRTEKHLTDEMINEMQSNDFRISLVKIILDYGGWNVETVVKSTFQFMSPPDKTIQFWNETFKAQYCPPTTFPCHFHFTIVKVAINEDGHYDIFSNEDEELKSNFEQLLRDKGFYSRNKKQ